MSSDFRYFWHLLTTQQGVQDPTDKAMDLAQKIELRRGAVAQYMAALSSWDEVEARMSEMNLAWGVVRDPVNIRDQATVTARGSIVDIDNREGGTRPITQSPYRFSDASSHVQGVAPHRGEHNTEVLQQWLSKSEYEIAALAEAGILQHDAEALG